MTSAICVSPEGVGAALQSAAGPWASRPGSRQLTEYRPQIFGTGPDVRDGPFVFGFFGEDRVLFEGVPAAVAMCPYMSDDGTQVDVPLTQGPVYALFHGLAVGELHEANVGLPWFLRDSAGPKL